MANVEWDKIKAEYLAGGTSYRKLEDKYGVSYQSISRRAKAENWQELKSRVKRKAETKVVQKIASQRAADIATLDAARSKLIHKLAGAIDKLPDMAGNRMEQSMTEQIEVFGNPDHFGVRRRKPPKMKTVRVESDLLKMTDMLEKLMGMTGYTFTPDEDVDDGFLDALKQSAGEVKLDDADVPEDIQE